MVQKIQAKLWEILYSILCANEQLNCGTKYKLIFVCVQDETIVCYSQ